MYYCIVYTLSYTSCILYNTYTRIDTLLDAISSLTSSLTRIGPKDVVEGRGDSWVPRLEERRSVGGQNGSEENAVNGVLKDIA